MTSPGRGSNMHVAPKKEKVLVLVSFIKLTISPSALLHILPFFPHTWFSLHFLWPSLDYQSGSLTMFESKDSWKCLPAISSLHQPVPMKSQVISSSTVFKKKYFAGNIFVANSPLDAKQVGSLVLSKGKAYLHTFLCADFCVPISKGHEKTILWNCPIKRYWENPNTRI